MSLLLCAWTCSVHARADVSDRVVLLDGPGSDELGLELSARVRGELRAAGFEVVVLAWRPDIDPRAATVAAAREFDPLAALVVRTERDNLTGEQVAEVWISDGRGEPRHERVPLLGDASRAVAKLAVQVADVVKARLAELSIAERRALELQTPMSLPPPLESPPERTTVDGFAGIALGALADLAARDAALLPLVRAGVAWRIPDSAFDVELRATLGGFGNDVTVQSNGARAELAQALGSIDLVFRFDDWGPIEPSLYLGAGAYTLRAEGVRSAGYRARSKRSWSALGTLGAGVSYGPVSWLRWSFDLQGIATTPASVIRIAERDQPERGSWLLLASTGMAWVF